MRTLDALFDSIDREILSRAESCPSVKEKGREAIKSLTEFLSVDILNDCFFPHQPNKYVSEKGSIHVSVANILKKNKKLFVRQKLSGLQILFNEIKFIIYWKLRFNLKNIRKIIK